MAFNQHKWKGLPFCPPREHCSAPLISWHYCSAWQGHLSIFSSGFSRAKLRPETGFPLYTGAPGKESALVLGTKGIIRLKHLPSRGFLLIPLTLQLQVPLEEVMKHHAAGLQQGKCCFPQRLPRALQRTVSPPLPFSPQSSLSKSHKGNRVSKPSFAIAISGLQTVPGAFWQQWTLSFLSIEWLIRGDWGYHLNKSCDHLR